MRAIGEADRRRCARDFFGRDDMRQVAHCGAAVLFFNCDPQQAQVAELAPKIHGEFIRPVNCLGTRRYLISGKSTHRVAKHVNFLPQSEIEGRQFFHKRLAGLH